IDAIEEELALYGGLEDRPRLVALNKTDVPEARELADLVAPELRSRDLRAIPVSAASHEGLRELSFAMAELVTHAREQATQEAVPRIVVRPAAVDDAAFTVTRDEERFVVLGAKPVRWVRQTDFSNDEAVGYLADRLARLGVEAALLKAGATAGAEVVIGDRDD